MMRAVVPLEVVGVAGAAATSWVIAMTIDPSLAAAAVVTVVVALSAASIAIIKAVTESKKELLEAAASAAVKVGEVHDETKSIAHSVDGAASKQVDRIEMLEQRVEQLIRQLSDAKDTASTLAATAAATIPGVDAARQKGKAEGVEEERKRAERTP